MKKHTQSSKNLALKVSNGLLALVLSVGVSGIFSSAWSASSRKSSASNSYKSLQSNQSRFTKNFASGSIVSGSRANASNSERRWYIFIVLETLFRKHFLASILQICKASGSILPKLC